MGDLAEALGRLGVVGIAVGMKLFREAAIGLLDLGLGGAALDAQSLVQIHPCPLLQQHAQQAGCRAGTSKPRRGGHGRRSHRTCSTAWFAEAQASEPNDPEAMALATADADGRPSVRMVLLKGHDARGFVFYTNLDSRKGDELAANPQAALLFHWKSLRRQVRIEGPVSAVSDAEADAYFAIRGRDSRLGAWASDQSRPLPDRATFEARVEEMRARFGGGDVPRPPRWSGFRVTPRGSNSGTTATHAFTNGACSCATGARLERRPALPMTAIPRPAPRSTLTTRAALASIAMAIFLVGLKSWAAIAHRLGRDARQPRRHRARSARQRRHPRRGAHRRRCRPMTTIASATARPRRWRRWPRSY